MKNYLKQYNKKFALVALVFAVLYSRFVGLEWGLPYPMHPDERNIAVSIQQLNCNDVSDLKTCFNPNFYAYGQPPIYLAYGVAKIGNILNGIENPNISFEQATVALRVISVFASLLTSWLLIEIYRFLQRKKSLKEVPMWVIVIATFSPYMVQYAHFGTTEALLMLLYVSIVFLSLRLLTSTRSTIQKILPVAALCGFSVAVKTSALPFIAVPCVAMLFVASYQHKNLFQKIFAKSSLKMTWNVVRSYLFHICIFFAICIGIFALFSPHTMLNFKDFLGSMKYETEVGRGIYKAFYTRQFEFSRPILFQMVYILPFALGILHMLFAIIGFFRLSWKKAEINILRFAILIFALPTMFFYAKWSRFLAPIFPVLTVLAILSIEDIFNFLNNKVEKQKFNLVTLVLSVMIAMPGIAYISIYKNPDVRFVASEWIYNNLPQDSVVLSETANVVDIPMPSELTRQDSIRGYGVISFDSYNVHTDLRLQEDLKNFSETSDYIFVPTRRVFSNHTCLWPESEPQVAMKQVFGFEEKRCEELQIMYPQLNNYYTHLFNPSEYQLLQEFTSYPRISIFGKKIYEIRDEMAEETWTVFDHPVVRVYRKISP